jgi:DNA repair protein RadA/Sms
MKRDTAFFCSECGNEYAKWLGQCPACGAWNTLVEQPSERAAPGGRKTVKHAASVIVPPVRLDSVSLAEEVRLSTGLTECDRVMGGGAVTGALYLLAGDPGIGKSTLLMQVCGNLSRRNKVLYCSGEESVRQIRLRGERLGKNEMLVAAQTDLDGLLAYVRAEKPVFLAVDSIQTMRSGGIGGAPGSVSQVRECALTLMRLAKDEGITVFLVGHITKDGAIAGPKVLEHMVDCVLYLEGDRHLRVLRAEKNRFGSTAEIGVFEMAGEGLMEVPNPSEALLAGRPVNVSGTCVACLMEGARPVLAEIQALVTPTPFPSPRRTVNGIEYNRAMLLMAVLEKRAGLYMGNQDAYINIVGGLRVSDTSADLPTLLALASSHTDKPLPPNVTAFGEVGLAGELRTVSFAGQRLSEAFRLGFTSAVIPNVKNTPIPEGMKVLKAKTLKEACSLVFSG